jgi:hypothetical protein
VIDVVYVQRILVAAVLVLACLVVADLVPLAHRPLVKYLRLDVSEPQVLWRQMHNRVLSVGDSRFQTGWENALVPR